MPIFNYVCENEECENSFEKLLKKRDQEDELECPECGQGVERKKFYGDHMIKYEADGFHRTDYEDKNSQ